MPIQPISNSIITTSSGLIGGLAKVYSSGYTQASITIQHCIDVGFYAAVSAIVGYSVKLCIDFFRRKIKNRQP